MRDKSLLGSLSPLLLLLLGVFSMQLAGCQSSPFKRADHGMASVKSASESSPKILIAGGYRTGLAGRVDLNDAVLLDTNDFSYKVLGSMSSPRRRARIDRVDRGNAPAFSDAIVVGGDTFFLERYAANYCSFKNRTRLHRKRLYGFTLSEAGSGHAWLIIGGQTEFSSPGIDPDLANVSSSADDTAEIVGGGGYSDLGFVDSCSIPYQSPLPTSVTDSSTLLQLNVARRGHTATWIPNQGSLYRLLVVGGNLTDGRPELLSLTVSLPPPPILIQSIRTLPLDIRRSLHTASRLQDGRVLIAGGTVDSTGVPSATAQTFDSSLLTLGVVAPMITPRMEHTASLLADGRVLLIGGRGASREALSTTEIFDPRTNTFSPGPPLNEARMAHAVVGLRNQTSLLVTGGVNSTGTVSSAEVCDMTSFACSVALVHPE